jgi:glycosyltransferase involved in cell wall biosynthesis
MPLVSVGLPVRNGAERIERVVKSVLTQDHQDLELVISDNASTDGTEQLCRELVAADSRITYHRHPENLGILNNFQAAIRLARGEFFRWVSDDDWLEPTCVSRSLAVFATDDRLILVTAQLAYIGEDGMAQSAVYEGTRLRSDDPVERFTEMLRLLSESYLLIDPLYGLFRRSSAMAIARRNMLREDQVFAAKLALAGPWGHVPEVLGHRHWKDENTFDMVSRLGVPAWHAHFATTLQCREMARWLDDPDPGIGLTDEQRRRARAAVRAMWLHRQRHVAARRTRRLVRIVTPR